MLQGISTQPNELWTLPGSEAPGQRLSLPGQNDPQSGEAPSSGTPLDKELSSSEERRVEELKRTDRRVRQHERAHMAAAGGLAVSGAVFQYTTGPDGKRYAVAGEVNIRAPQGGDPDKQIETVRKMKRAALAPADPSAQDRSVAAAAARMEVQARMKKADSADEDSAESENAAAAGNTEDDAGRPGMIADEEKRPGTILEKDEETRPGMRAPEETRPGMIVRDEVRPGMITSEALQRYTEILRQDLQQGDPFPEMLLPYLKEKSPDGQGFNLRI